MFSDAFIKFNVSMANDKIDFMKSLELFCVKNAKEWHSKENWKVLSLENIAPLKESSVVFTSISNIARGQLLINQTDLAHHEHQYYQSNECNGKDIFQKQQNIERRCTQSTGINISKNTDNIASVKSNARKRKGNNGVTLKVTLKIGNEVISKKYCKKKYLNQELLDKQIIIRSQDCTDCANCNSTKNSLYCSRVRSNIATCDPVCSGESEEKWFMAAVLVEYAMQRRRLQSVKAYTFDSDEQTDFQITNVYNGDVDGKEHAGDVVVPEEN